MTSALGIYGIYGRIRCVDGCWGSFVSIIIERSTTASNFASSAFEMPS
jgi:hypothetical protein